MQRIRITVLPQKERSEELKCAALLRRDLYAFSPVEIDPDNRLHGSRIDDEGRVFFEFATSNRSHVDRVIDQHGYKEKVIVQEWPEPKGAACVNCGAVVADQTPAVCPVCEFRDISPCSNCKLDVSRQAYIPIAGDIFRCPECEIRVRLAFNDPIVKADGEYNEPLVIVRNAAQS